MHMPSYCKWTNIDIVYSYLSVFQAGGHSTADNIDLDIVPSTSNDAGSFDFLPLLRYMSTHHDVSWKFSRSAMAGKYLALRSLKRMLNDCAMQSQTAEFGSSLTKLMSIKMLHGYSEFEAMVKSEFKCEVQVRWEFERALRQDLGLHGQYFCEFVVRYGDEFMV
jgi:hypothetical protein